MRDMNNWSKWYSILWIESETWTRTCHAKQWPSLQVACEAEEVECGHIIVHHSTDSNVAHYALAVRVSSLKGELIIRDDAHKEEMHLSPSGLIRGRQTWEERWLYWSHS